MKKRPRTFIVAALLLGVIVVLYGWYGLGPREPSYDGKRLSVWLDEFSPEVHGPYPDSPAVRAVRAIGSDAVPWLVAQFHTEDLTWRGKVNRLLEKQHLIKYRFKESVKVRFLGPRLRRGIHGIEALGEVAAPAIPELLALVERHPAHIPATLVWIGHPAVPAVQQCLTNTKPYRHPIMGVGSIPADVLTHINNAYRAGRLSDADIEMLGPAIHEWAAQTPHPVVLLGRVYSEPPNEKMGTR